MHARLAIYVMLQGCYVFLALCLEFTTVPVPPTAKL